MTNLFVMILKKNKIKGKKLMKIVFIRHGKTKTNALLKIQGHVDTHLDPEWFFELKNTAEFLKQKKLMPNRILVSPFSRAFETAVFLKNELKLNLPLFAEIQVIEREFGEFEGLPTSLIPSLKTGRDYENDDMLLKRAESFLKQVNQIKSGTCYVICHSHFIKTIVWLLTKEKCYTARFLNGGVIVVEKNQVADSFGFYLKD